MKGSFRSLGYANFRLWAVGALLSYVGTWMQRTAQDWLVLTQLTDGNATTVGGVMALQFGPQLLFLPVTGLATDALDRRKLLIATEAAMGTFALILGLLVATATVQLWHVYVLALALGCVAAFDVPARQTFVAELVPDSHLTNAIALNSTLFNAARMIGPAVAGLLIAGLGTGYVFLVDTVSSAALIALVLAMRSSRLRRVEKARSERGGLVEGFRYVARRSKIVILLLMLFLVGSLAINFPIFVSTMSVTVFHAGAARYGLLTSMMAAGSVAGALIAAGLERPSIAILLTAAGGLGSALLLAAAMPSYIFFGAALVLVGLAAQIFTTTANSAAQLWTSQVMRGRVMAIVFAVLLGSTPFGAPCVGWAADRFGPRWAMVLGAVACFVAAALGLAYLFRRLRRNADTTGGR